MQALSLSNFNVGDYLQIIFRRKWLFIIPCGLVVFVATIGSFFLPQIYQAQALILIQQRQLLQPLVQGMAVPTTMEQELQTLIEQILSFSRLEEMIREIGLDKNIPKGNVPQLERFIKGLKNKIGVTPKRGSPDLIEIIFEDASPVIAQKVVNYVTESFVRENVISKEEEADAAINFIRKQLEIYRLKLEDSESALRAFKERNLLEMPGFSSGPQVIISGEGFSPGGGGAQIGQSVGGNVQKLVGFQDSLLNLRMELEGLKKKRDLIKRQLSGQDKITRFQSKEANPLVAKLSATIVDMQMQLSELYTKKYTDKHPWVIALKKNIKRAKEQLTKTMEQGVTVEKSDLNPAFQDLERQLRETDTNINALQAREERLIELSGRYAKLTLDVPAKEQELAKLTRDTSINQSIYAMLLQKLETANISQRLESAEKGTRFKVVNPARLPIEPISPNKRLIAMLSLFIGAVIGFGAVFAGEYTDHSFRNLEDAEAFLEIPSLGSISKIITETEVIENKRRLKIRAILGSIIFVIGLLITYILIVFVKG